MKFAIESGQHQFFRRNRFLETEGLLTEKELNELNTHIDKALVERLKIKEEVLKRQFSNDIFREGRDLSRIDDYIKKNVLHNRFAEIAAELIEFRPLRFGYDQLFINSKENESNPYKNLILEPVALKDISSLQNVLCAAMICLKNEDEETALESSIFPKKAGNVTFFSGDVLIDFKALIGILEKRYLMIVYTQKTSIYYVEERDPKGHHLKNLGYVYGDRLNDKLNPIVYR